MITLWMLVTCSLQTMVEAWGANAHTGIAGHVQMQKIRDASTLSSAAAQNISAAYEACELWSDILCQRSEYHEPLPKKIQVLCLVLQASCLVRVGDDESALLAYSRAEEFQDQIDNQTKEKILLGKGSSLQRLMKYREAIDCFGCCTSPEAICAAATCALRSGNASLALHLLEPGRHHTHSNADSLQAILNWLEGGPLISRVTSELSLCDSHLCRWIMSLAQTNGPISVQNRSLLELALVNIGPFDDPSLINLDDKILLHGLVRDSDFWPQSLVLPDDVGKLEAMPESDLWMKKKRSGYGSHGNEIVRTSQAMSLTEPFLLQRLIDPTYLLPDHRKFSMRVYVIYFLPLSEGHKPDVFVSKHGLVKVATSPVGSHVSEADDSVYMTNSGRNAEMRQEPLAFLERLMDSRGHSFDLMWDRIIVAVEGVMQVYDSKANSSMDKYRASLGRMAIPKILGFDFVVDSEQRPWLLEVNRFPGLEPRGPVDQDVKERVVHEAWSLAAKRLNSADKDSLSVLSGR